MTLQNEQNPKTAPNVSGYDSAVDYHTLLDTIGISVSRHLLNEDIPVLWANDHFYRITGYTKEEYHTQFSGLREYYRPLPEDFKTLNDALRSACDNGEPVKKINCRLPVKGGGFIWIQLTVSITGELADGCPVFTAVCSDISGQIREQEEQARLLEEKAGYFKWLMDEYEGNVYISDMDNYELLYLNKVATATLQMTPEDILGRKCYEVIQKRTSPCSFCTNDCLTKDKFYEWEFYNPNLERNFLIKNRVIDWNGHRARIELSHDMYSTEYKLAKKDRERDALIRTIPGGFSRLDARDLKTILWYGANFLELIGYTQEQFENELHSQCTYIDPEDWSHAAEMMRHLKNTNQNIVLEMSITTHSGETRILTVTMSYVSGKDSWDGIPSFYSVGIDVTEAREEQRRQRKALEDAYQALRVANSAKTNFLSSMSHDIRTPMNAIVGMTAIAQANLASRERINDCLNKINVSSRHLLSLINEVLDMSKIESGKIDLTPVDIDLSELIQSVSDMCRPLIAEKDQDFQIIIGQVRHEKVAVDGDRLQQVFMNLLSNAIKYTPEGGKISMRINEIPSLIPQKGWYEFIFTDNGIGMTEDFISRIFEPFSRAEDSRISKIQGTGLGMAITENIVHMMNGTITVKSEPGAGSQFTVSLPLQLQNAEDILNRELIGLPILIADDDPVVCESAVLLLNELGMRGYWVLSGAEAICTALDAHNRADDFFAVIIDWKMPEMDGLETVKAIRKQLGEDVPVIIISAYDYSDIEEEFVKAGADAFITKPLFKSKLLRVLHLFCTSGRPSHSNAAADEAHANLNGRRILLAEDNELNREIAVELLGMHGIEVDSAENGKEAVECFTGSAPGYYTAVLMDIQMPVMDGYAATEAIRALPREDAQTIPILALTANAFVSDVGRAQSVGMNDHIAKPIDMDRLMGALNKWVD